MGVLLGAGALTFIFTTLLTIAGLGAAFILIPVFNGLGVELYDAMSVALLLNSIAMIFATIRFSKKKLIMWKTAVPIIIASIPFSFLGARVAGGIDRDMLRWFFVGFLLFAAVMMLFYRAKEKEQAQSKGTQIAIGITIGVIAGFVGGLIGVGGGNMIVPTLVWLGFNPKKASATTSFIVIFSSFVGFLGHISSAGLSYSLLGVTAVASIIGALLGAYLMTDKLNKNQVKILVGIILIAISAKMIFKLL